MRMSSASRSIRVISAILIALSMSQSVIAATYPQISVIDLYAASEFVGVVSVEKIESVDRDLIPESQSATVRIIERWSEQGPDKSDEMRIYVDTAIPGDVSGSIDEGETIVLFAEVECSGRRYVIAFGGRGRMPISEKGGVRSIKVRHDVYMPGATKRGIRRSGEARLDLVRKVIEDAKKTLSEWNKRVASDLRPSGDSSLRRKRPTGEFGDSLKEDSDINNALRRAGACQVGRGRGVWSEGFGGDRADQQESGFSQ